MDTVLLWLLNIGYLAYLAAYAVRDIFWFRLLTIAGGFTAISYFVSSSLFLRKRKTTDITGYSVSIQAVR